jgi:hypothetical protein
MTETITFKKTQRGEWAVCGPVSAVREGTEVTVTKRSGDTKRVYIERIGRQFQADGQAMVYGYIGQARATGATQHEVSAPHGTRTIRHRSGCRCWGCYDENS